MLLSSVCLSVCLPVNNEFQRVIYSYFCLCHSSAIAAFQPCWIFYLSYVESTGIEAFRNKVKNEIRKAAFEYFKNIQKNHTKVKDIKYEMTETKPYLKSLLFSNEEKQLLFSLKKKVSQICKISMGDGLLFIVRSNAGLLMNFWWTSD